MRVFFGRLRQAGVKRSDVYAIGLAIQRIGYLAMEFTNMWLNRGTIDGDDTVLPRMLAYVTYYHQERIDQSIAANAKKALHIRYGILLGIAAPIVLLTLLAAGRWIGG